MVRNDAGDSGGQVTPVLSLVVPAYNEEDSLPALYSRTVEALGTGLAWELVLVDDGSRDRTAAVMRELHAVGYDGPLVSEVSTSLASLEATARAMRNIRAL